MSSPISSALTKFDECLQTLQNQFDSLRATLEIDRDQLSQSLDETCQHATRLRDLIRSERPDAKWIDRPALDQLVKILEAEASAKDNEQRRTRLLDLAREFDAGMVKHRFDPRTAALNALRQEAVKELQTAAAHSEQVKDLPGPNASEWLRWVCSLQDKNDALILASLRENFSAVERFVGEMEESYWIPGTTSMRKPKTAL